MIEIPRLGENATHPAPFEADRVNGYPFFLLLLVRSEAEFLVDGQWVIVPPGTAFIFRPGQRQCYHARGVFYIDNWAHIISRQPILDRHFPYGQPIPLHNAEQYYSLFHLLCSEFFGRNPHRQSIIHCLAKALFEKISDLSGSQERSPIYNQLLRLRTEIYSSPKKDWQVEQIAKELMISEGYFYSLYKQIFGTTCMQDVIQSRMEAAFDLLLSTTKPIGEIAEQCGYHHTEHFLRQFKRNAGITPLQYRKKYRLNNLI